MKYYDDLAKNITIADDLKPKGYKEQIQYDIEFIRKFASKDKILLDIGSGTGLTINHLVNDFKKIIAIEKYKEFSQFIDKNIEIHNLDILEDKLEFNNIDIVTAFGLFQSFKDEVVIRMYREIYELLLSNGIFIIKHAMGLKEDIYFENKSKSYWAIYRHINKELHFLMESGFNIIGVYNIYQDKFKSDKTNYFSIVGIK